VHGLGEPWETPLLYPKTGKRRATVEYNDLWRLDEGKLLNDNLIGFFMRYLEHYLEQSNSELAKRVCFYNSYFFERLTQDPTDKRGIDYKSVQNWTRKIDIFRSDFVVIESHHWYLVIIYNLSEINTMAGGDEAIATEVSSLMKPRLSLTEKGEEARESQDRPTQAAGPRKTVPGR
jgi:sentrin-specific protease 7